RKPHWGAAVPKPANQGVVFLALILPCGCAILFFDSTWSVEGSTFDTATFIIVSGFPVFYVM
ncbi:MAG TPA: hypothetical protein P5560_11235, partial [Thermotogota bacterium]|nr:hypothetical protein [Thermotogota bacterium]